MWPGRARRCRWSILHICTLLNFQLLPELLPSWFQLQVVRFLGGGEYGGLAANILRLPLLPVCLSPPAAAPAPLLLSAC